MSPASFLTSNKSVFKKLPHDPEADFASVSRLVNQPMVLGVKDREKYPTMAEAGVADLDLSAWMALLAPARTLRAIVDQLNRGVATHLEPYGLVQLVQTELHHRNDAPMPRPSDVKHLFVWAWHNRRIAEKLGISCLALEAHKARLLVRLGVRPVVELVRLVDRKPTG